MMVNRRMDSKKIEIEKEAEEVKQDLGKLKGEVGGHQGLFGRPKRMGRKDLG